jgi:hypothetical protein
MKRYTHAWIALRAIDRLGQLADGVLEDAIRDSEKKQEKASKETDPKKKEDLLREADDLLDEGKGRYDSIKNLQTMLRSEDFIKLVVQGTWVPDNVIKDNREGHVWKYEPPLKKGKDYTYNKDGKKYAGYVVTSGKNKTHYRTDHAETSSLCYREAKHAYAWEKLWHKFDGFLADRCEAVHQTVRDLFLFQKDEMHKLAATLIVKFGDELFDKRDEVTAFLADPDEVKAYYDTKVDGKYVNRGEIVDLRNQIGQNSEVNVKVKNCLEGYREEIKNHITKLNGMRFIDNKRSFFPMFFTDDQIVLSLFSLSHYLADAHMPLHCDTRTFSSTACGNIHGDIEEEWENWIITKNDQTDLRDILSETERAEKFMKLCFNGKEPVWNNFQYPPDSILAKFDEELGDTFWDNQKISFYEKTGLWDELVGISYASYCLASRLVAFNDAVRTVPKGTGKDYAENFTGAVRRIKGDEWKTAVDEEGIKDGLTGDQNRRLIYNFAVKHGGDNVAFNYLSLLILVDSVECVAKVWGKIVKDHLDVTYEAKKPY